MHENIDPSSATRNGGLRAKTAGIRRLVAEKVLDHTPLKADHVSFIGTGTVLKITEYATSHQEELKENLKLATAVGAGILLAYCTDGIDGAMARVEDERDPEQADTGKGQLVDVLNDSMQEKGTAALRYAAAKRRQDQWGQMGAAGAYITNDLPRIFRAKSEAMGHPVPEEGRTIFERLGTRESRIVLGTLATVFPKVQPILDLVATGANLYTASQRGISMYENRNTPPTLSLEIQQEGRKRSQSLAIAAVGMSIAGVAADIYIRNSDNMSYVENALYPQPQAA